MNPLIKTIIVEDEPLSRLFLKNLLAEFCPSVQVLAMYATENEAVEAIEQLQPHLVFMDIELQQGTGFAVLQRTRQLHYHVIFTTALDYASIRAIRFSGVDYIQKPIDIQSLQSLIDCRHGEMITSNGKLAVQHLLHTLDHDNLPAHLLVAGLHGREYIALDDILFVESQGEGTVFIMESGSIQVPSVSIKEYEKLLAQSYFFRLHSSFIVNMRKIVLPSVPETGYVMLYHNRTVPVSPKKSGELALLLSAGDPSPSAR